MKTNCFIVGIAFLACIGCTQEHIAFPQDRILSRDAKGPDPPPPPPVPDCDTFTTDHDLAGTIDDVDGDGQWFSIWAEGTVTSYLGTGTSAISMLYHSKSGSLEGSISADYDSLYMYLTFSTTVFGSGMVTIDFPQVNGTVTTAGQVIYTMTAGNLEIDVPVMQEGSTSINAATIGEYCNDDPGGVGCWAGNG